MTTPTFVSIDWDFFTSYPAAGEELHSVHGDLVTEECVRPILCPFEVKGPVVQRQEWDVVIERARRHDVDISDYFGVLRGPQPACFTSKLSERYAITGKPLRAYDSHRHAYPRLEEAVARNGNHPVNVISFDAHHDMGYDAGSLDGEEWNAPTCENWLFWAIRNRLADRVTLVLPDWLVDDEERIHARSFLIRSEQARVEILSYEQWLAQAAPEAPLAASEVFLARSGWWAPPWADKSFLGLVDNLTGGTSEGGHEMTPTIIEEGLLTLRPHAALRCHDALLATGVA